jgi:hypothetical protein
MSRFFTLSLIACIGLLVAANVLHAGRRGCCCGGGSYAPAVVVPAPVPPPAPPAAAAAPQAYRSYSYQPEMSSGGYSNSFLRTWGGHAYENAANKSRGRVN